MLKVADGEVDDYKGWTQGAISPDHCRMTPRADFYRRKRVEEVMRGITKTEPAKLPPAPRPDKPASPPTTTFKPYVRVS
jgi:hypothetical protein